MPTPEPHDPQPTPPAPSPLDVPLERTRNWSADDLEVDLSTPNLDLTFDDEQRLEEDAHPGAD